MKKLKLSMKISLMICAILIIIFAILIMISARSSSNTIRAVSYGEVSAYTQISGAEVEKILRIAESSTKSMSNYMQTVYENRNMVDGAEKMEADEAVDNNPALSSYIAQEKRMNDLKNTSEIFPNLVLSEANREIESFLLETAKNTILSNEDIAGIAVMFEPYAFSKKLESYSFYVWPAGNGNLDVATMGDYSDYSKETFYKSGIQNKSLTITEPYTDKTTGIYMITVLSPIMLNGEVQGVITADISIESLKKINISSAEYDTIYSALVNDKGMVIYHDTQPELIGTDFSNTFATSEKLQAALDQMASGKAFSMECKNEVGAEVTKFYAPIRVGDNVWWANCTVEKYDILDRAIKATILLIIVSVIGLALIVAFTTLILRRQLRPINDIVAAAQKIAHGNLDIALEVKNQDEIGILAIAFNDTADYLKCTIERIAYVLNEIADNNLKVDTQAEYRGAFERIGQSIHNITSNLNNLLWQIKQSADQVSSGSEQVSGGAQALSQGATEQASSVEELAATINEISSQVKKNAGNAGSASAQADVVGEQMEASNRAMQDMIAAMDKISQSASEIKKIIKTIEDIAFQTNILALNAAVEAARAGEAGKGFAVVADEVRNLASKSAQASKNTSILIESALQAVENGTRIAGATAGSLQAAVENARDVTNIINQISVASGEQANSIAQVTLGIDQISSVVQTNSATAEESAAASEELSGQAQVLKNFVGQFMLNDVG